MKHHPTFKSQRRQGGFTIAELLVATAVFSVVLLAALASFLGVGHLFYKGVSLTSTQNTATQVLNDISDSIASASSVSTSTSANGYIYTCIGNTRYTYTYTSSGPSNTRAVPASDSSTTSYNSGNVNNPGNFGLLKDTLSGSTACSVPCASGGAGSGCFNQTSPIEMLDQNMRVENLSVCSVPGSPNLYNVKIEMAYGDNSVFRFSSSPSPPCAGTAVNNDLSCTGGSSNQAFCAVVNLSTTVTKGLGV